MATKRTDPVVVVLLLACLITATLALVYQPDLAFEAHDSPTITATLERSSSSSPAAPRKPQPTSTLNAYSEISQRPLFYPSRRKPQAVETAAQKPSDNATAAKTNPQQNRRRSADLVLTGIVKVGELHFALLHDPRTRTTYRAEVGEEVSGWQLEALSFNTATVTRGEQSKTISLERKSDQRLAAQMKAARQKRREPSAAEIQQPSAAVLEAAAKTVAALAKDPELLTRTADDDDAEEQAAH